MDVTGEDKGSLSSYITSEPSSRETFPKADEQSNSTPATSISQDDTTLTSNEKPTESEPELLTPKQHASEDERKDKEPTASHRRSKKNRRFTIPANPNSDSDSVSSSGSDMPGYLVDRIRQWGTPQSLFDGYKELLKEKAAKKIPKGNAEKVVRKDQGSNLVRGLVDYMRVMEDRIDLLESDKAKAGDTSISKPSEDDDSTVEVTVKFFDSAAYLGEDGSYPDVHSETEKGTFMCGHDTQHLIRVLYTKAKKQRFNPHNKADEEPPNADEIDILTFGVSSEAIATFFGKKLDIVSEDNHLIRFGKPFRPLIRNLSQAKEQLRKLEDIYGQVLAEDVHKTFTVKKETENASLRYEKTDVLPYKAAKDDTDEVIQSFDRPAALPHFRAFVAFVDEYLGKQIQLYGHLRQGIEQQVAFENLWMLFDVNDTICCPLREGGKKKEEYLNDEGADHTPIRRHTSQAYRVVATSGGMQFTGTMAPTFKTEEIDESSYPTSLHSALMDTERSVKQIANLLTHTAKNPRRIRTSYTEFIVYCFYVDYNGAEYGAVRDVFVFKPYEREIEISSLQAYPIRYSKFHDHFHDRGKRFLDITRISHLQYQGLTVGLNREEINSPVVVDVKLAFESGTGAQEVIQVPEFLPLGSLWLMGLGGGACDLFGKSSCGHKWCYNRKCTTDIYARSQRIQRTKVESHVKLVLEEYESEKKRGEEGQDRFKQLIENRDLVRLLPGAVPGFALRNRRWVLLDIMRLEPVEHNSEWDNLVLPPGHREMVQAMVETYTQELDPSKDVKIGMDLVRGKGRGCIILLHGVPGVGKTSTAECVAAHAKKPLYPITCGDIGYTPEQVERNMENHFKLAHKWGCVLLLDEADVFLAKRDQKDVQRNGLVSGEAKDLSPFLSPFLTLTYLPTLVFLRILEYYSGILFLTTNRVGAIDDAFRSRLHLTLYYPKLTRKQTKQIFRRNFERIAEINAVRIGNNLLPFEYKDCEPKVMLWSKETWKTLRWNGRQIRNTFQTVLALAEFQARNHGSELTELVIRKKHFNIVANASMQFNEYLLAVHGADEDKVAKREYTRALEFSPSPGTIFKGLDEDSSDSSSEDTSKGSTSHSESDDSDESNEGKKNSSKRKKGKETKSSSKKSKKASEKKAKSEKKLKKKGKAKEDDDGSD
ncbi:hypothetical protein F5Y05DRAFT_330604 [Hypoxylon sp. FL0543]|nr:hypothetical protein F5Y05DRAFT_330604 [Hypoxylon sp. FL0543]